MNLTDRQKDLAKWWTGVYQYHRTQLVTANAVMYAKDVESYSLQELESAWHEYRKEQTRPPMPSNLIQRLGQKLNVEKKAQLMAGNLFLAVSHYGKYGTCFVEESQTWLKENICQPSKTTELEGRIALAVVDQLGGWRELWKRGGDLVPEIAIGSWRKMFEVMLLSHEIEKQVCLPSADEAKRFVDQLPVDVKKLQAGDYE